MDLELKDRLILYNQYEILKRLDADKKEEYELNQIILFNGYKNYYDNILKGMIEDIDTKIMDSVENTLHLYNALISSYKNLPKCEQNKINEEDIAFKGYDFESEYKYYQYAYFLIYKSYKYENLKNIRGFNIKSNSPKLKVYKDILLKIEEVKDGSHDKFSLDSILQIINQYNSSN